MRPLSYSQIRSFRTCPLRYRFVYLHRMPERQTPESSLGRSLHKAVEIFFRAGGARPMPLPILLQEFEGNFETDGFDGPQALRAARTEGRAILERFWNHETQNFRRPVAVERRFRVDVGGVPVNGVVDRIDRLPDGSLEVVDYKTGVRQSGTTEDDVADNLQLAIYQLGVAGAYREPVSRLSIHLLRDDRRVSVPARDAAVLDAVRETIREVARRIGEGELDPTESPLCPCEFSTSCPLFGGTVPPLPDQG